MIYMIRIQNMPFFLLKVNNLSVRHPVWPPSDTLFGPVWPPVRPLSGTLSGLHLAPVEPCLAPFGSLRLAPCLAPVGHPVWPPVVLHPCGRSKKIKIKIILFYFLKFIFIFGCCRLEKRGGKYFGFQSPRSPSSPSSAGFTSEAARRRRFFRPNSPNHPSKLYSSLGWLNSKVPKPFFPFILRLIDVDGF
jgi:hypothetical protein